MTSRIPLFVTLILALSSCGFVPETSYQRFILDNPQPAVYYLGGLSETLGAYAPGDGSSYPNIRTVGLSGSGQAWPAALHLDSRALYVLNSGQNRLESYEPATLDYLASLHLGNGMNPLSLIPVPDSSLAFVTGYQNDAVSLVDLSTMVLSAGPVASFEEVQLPTDSHAESTVAPTSTNAMGDNRKRRTSGGAVYGDGNGGHFYATNVRYDAGILLTDDTGNLVVHNGTSVRAPGQFRQGSLSIYSYGPSSLALERELNLQDFIGEYAAGDGLNPQSALLLENRLHVICTGANGGSIRYFSSGDYIPPGFAVGDPIPGTDPDDGLVLVFSLNDPENPVLEETLEIGGSPSAFTEALDGSRQVAYLAGVGGVQSYCWETDVERVLRDSDHMILVGSNSEQSYYAGLAYDDNALFISDFSGDSLIHMAVSGTVPETLTYTEVRSVSTDDGPGVLLIR